MQKAMFQQGCNNLPLTNQQQNVGEAREKKGGYNKIIKVQIRGWRSRKLSKLDRGLEVQELLQLGKRGLRFKRNQAERRSKLM